LSFYTFNLVLTTFSGADSLLLVPSFWYFHLFWCWIIYFGGKWYFFVLISFVLVFEIWCLLYIFWCCDHLFWWWKKNICHCEMMYALYACLFGWLIS
jgi:hypothetical protein